MPKPREGEKKSDFVDRCIPQVIEDGTAKDPKQAYAVCVSIYEQHKEKTVAEKFFAWLKSLVGN